jgi:hypothetical protein
VASKSSYDLRQGEALQPQREPIETLDRIPRTIGEYNFASGEIVALTTIDGAVKTLDLDRPDFIEADIEGWSCDCCTVPRAPSDVSGRACYWRSPAARRRPDRFHSSTRCRSRSGKAIEVTLVSGLRFLRSRSPRENVFDGLGGKVELNESDPAIEGFAVMRDQPIPKTKAAHALKKTGRHATSGSSEA